MEPGVDIEVALGTPVDRAASVLTGVPGTLFEPDAPPGTREAGRFRLGLRVDVAERTTLWHEVVVEVRGATCTARGGTLDLHLQPVGHRTLLPVFDGVLEVRGDGTESRLMLRGQYDLPLGVIGRVSAALGGRRWAERFLEHFLAEVANRLLTEVEWRELVISQHPSVLSDWQWASSDYFLG